MIMRWRTNRAIYGRPGEMLVEVLSPLKRKRVLVRFEHDGQTVERWISPKRLVPIID